MLARARGAENGTEMTLEYQKENESLCSEHLMKYNLTLDRQLILRVSL